MILTREDCIHNEKKPLKQAESENEMRLRFNEPILDVFSN